MSESHVVILGAARTPIGRYGGTLRATHPAALGAAAARAAIARAGITPDDIDEVIVGHARQAGSGPNPARQVGRRTGLPDRVPAQTINQACASGLQSVALGAQAKAVSWLILRRGLVHLGIGLAIGLAGAFAVGRLLGSMLFQTSPADPVTLTAITVLLAGVSIAACLWPAWQASRLDPVTALRYE